MDISRIEAMGGVPVLLILAAMGVTYGWHPDGQGGVEYIVQIPPEQIEELQRHGEITSVIDPRIQGHVSRVVVKVGNEPLSQTTPAGWSQRISGEDAAVVRVAAHDDSPVPIPEITEPVPQGVDSFVDVGRDSIAAVMKPVGEDGFALPPSLMDAASRVPGSLRDGAADVAAEMDRRAREQAAQTAAQATAQARAAGGEMTDRAGNALRNAVSTVFGNQANEPNQAAATASPAFANQQPNFQTQQPTPFQTQQPTTVQPPAFTGADPTGAAARSRQAPPSTEPISQRDRDWYGLDGRPRMPTTDPVSTDPRATLAGPPDLRSTAPSNAAAASMNSGGVAAGPSAGANPAMSTSGLGTTPNFGRPPIDPRSADPRSANVDPRTVDPRQAAANFDSLSGQPSTNFGSSFTQATQPTYADPNAAAQNYAHAYQRTTATSAHPPAAFADPNQAFATSGQPMTTPPVYPPANYPPASYPQGNYPQGYYPPATYQPAVAHQAPLAQTADTRAQLPARSLESDRATLSASDRFASVTESSSRLGSHPKAATTQPLFNGMLLVSFVANIYLFFWLKNLRYRFRDLVAAKRVASASSSQA